MTISNAPLIIQFFPSCVAPSVLDTNISSFQYVENLLNYTSLLPAQDSITPPPTAFLSEPLSDVLASQPALPTISATYSPVDHEASLFTDTSAAIFASGPTDGVRDLMMAGREGKEVQGNECMGDGLEVLVAGGTDADATGGKREEIDKCTHSLYTFPCICCLWSL